MQKVKANLHKLSTKKPRVILCSSIMSYMITTKDLIALVLFTCSFIQIAATMLCKSGLKKKQAL